MDSEYEEPATVAELEGNDESSYLTVDRSGGYLFITSMVVKQSFNDSYENGPKLMGVSREAALAAENVVLFSYQVTKKDAKALADVFAMYANEPD